MTESSFQIYPAIDVLGGKCVRLLRGDYSAATTYSQDLLEVAERWLDSGAQWLHVVDLDAAKSGVSVNQKEIASIIRMAAVYGAKVQVGGGIRSLDVLRGWLDVGAERCVVGTQALKLDWMESAVRAVGGTRVIVGLDGRNGFCATDGWTLQTDVSIVDMAIQLKGVGVEWALVTDVDRDGTQSGANLELTNEVMLKSGLHTIVSGGIHSTEDVQVAKARGFDGVITGKAIYDGSLDLRVAIEAVAQC